MRQTSIFESTDSKKITKTHWKLFIDGASRNNPGPAGAGIFIIKDGELFDKQGFYVGSKTNNQAEYLALVLGLLHVKKHVHDADALSIISDSQLLIRQMKGEYKVRNSDLIVLHTCAKKLLSSMHAQLFHVLRIENQEADAMANYGIDKKKRIPLDYLTTLKQHGISI